MSEKVIIAAMQRINDHVRAHFADYKDEGVEIVLHGGEPLLAGKRYIERLVEIARAEIGPFAYFSLQTNGTLLDENWAQLFRVNDISVGISLDGDRIANDRHRLDRHGKSSFDKALAGIKLMQRPENRRSFSTILSVVDIANNPVDTYRFFENLEIENLDFLLPDATWDDPPGGDASGEIALQYGEWLCNAFDYWFDSNRSGIRVRFFDGLVSSLFGGSPPPDMGLSEQGWIVIESDGSIVENDVLKVAFDGAGKTGLSVLKNSFDEALRLPSMHAVHQPANALSETCQACPVVQVCGGGCYPHRYKSGTDFANPSVYCEALYKLITHANKRVHDQLNKQGVQIEMSSTRQTSQKVSP